MINHHDGALEMVKDLKQYPGTAYDSILNEFISELVNDQGVEIERMNGIAVNLSDEPRSSLAAGLYDAEQAILNLELVSSLKNLLDSLTLLILRLKGLRILPLKNKRTKLRQQKVYPGLFVHPYLVLLIPIWLLGIIFW